MSGFAVLWVAIAFVPLLESAQLNAVGRRIVIRESFRIKNLESLDERLSLEPGRLGCNARYLRGVALVRSRLAESALNRADLALMDSRLESLKLAGRSLVKCSPYDGFGWFILYWTTLNQIGASPEALNYLTMSYKVSPHEAWIALMRNAVALQVADKLPPETQHAITLEWKDIVVAGLHSFAAPILISANPSQRSRLLLVSQSIPEVTLRALARQVSRAGSDIEFPSLSFDERRRNY